jgi:hypothetical protein
MKGKIIMAKYLSNAFSIQMLTGASNTVQFDEVDPQTIDQENLVSVLGHADIANVVSSVLGKEYPVNRVSNKLEKGDIMYVAQLIGGRLPEGATSLPEGFSIKWYEVTII